MNPTHPTLAGHRTRTPRTFSDATKAGQSKIFGFNRFAVARSERGEFQVLDDLFGNPQAVYFAQDGGIGLWRGCN